VSTFALHLFKLNIPVDTAAALGLNLAGLGLKNEAPHLQNANRQF
jgi:hypothetical protein